MKGKRFVMILGLGSGLVLTPMWMISSTFDPAQANKDAIVIPTPTIDEVKVLRSSQNPFSRLLIDDQSPTQSGVTPLAPSSVGIANGDFENGPDGSWEESHNFDFDIIITWPELSQTPYSGIWAARLGGLLTYDSYISQTVTIPDEDPVLFFWYYLESYEDLCSIVDFGSVRINLIDVYTIPLCAENRTRYWEPQFVDLSAYAGQTVTLHIGVEKDLLIDSLWYIDDVALKGTSYTYIYLPLIMR